MESELTSALIGCGYLDRTTWTGQRPRYYLEVKTTTGDCDTRFYASKAQYKRVSTLLPYWSSFALFVFIQRTRSDTDTDGKDNP